MRRIAQDACLWMYRTVFADRLLHYSWGRRVFFALYDFYKTFIEAGEIDALKRYAPSGALVFDVGANVGFFSLKFARWVGDNGRVVAVEPESVNFSELTRRIAADGLEKRIIAHRAVADRTTGEVRLAVNRNHPGDHKIGAEGVATAAVTIDQLARIEGRPVSLIKIDVQGAELRVLAGAEAVLATDRPALFVEVDSSALEHFNASVGELLDFLRCRGYVPHTLGSRGATTLTRAMLDVQIAAKGYTDILFIATSTCVHQRT
jgi:FkbM family methyltransferase